jgi:hypothetical protein
MVTRFNAWAAANGETIDEATQQIGPPASRYIEGGTTMCWSLVVGVLSIGLFVLLFVIKKRKNKAK